MVPGSTLRYGSSFCMVTRSPRALSRRPRLEAVRPLPRLEATPPVTKRCLVDAGRDEYGTAAKGRLPWSVRSGESRRSTGHQDISQRLLPPAPHRDSQAGLASAAGHDAVYGLGSASACITRRCAAVRPCSPGSPTLASATAP